MAHWLLVTTNRNIDGESFLILKQKDLWKVTLPDGTTRHRLVKLNWLHRRDEFDWCVSNLLGKKISLWLVNSVLKKKKKKTKIAENQTNSFGFSSLCRDEYTASLFSKEFKSACRNCRDKSLVAFHAVPTVWWGQSFWYFSRGCVNNNESGLTWAHPCRIDLGCSTQKRKTSKNHAILIKLENKQNVPGT